MTKFREIVDAEYAKVRQLTADRKAAKKKIDAAFAEYKKFMKETYMPGRKAAFEAINKMKADRKATAAKTKADRVAAAKAKADEKAKKTKVVHVKDAAAGIAKGEAAIASAKAAANAANPSNPSNAAKKSVVKKPVAKTAVKTPTK